jgi:hypothetical protein
MAVERSRWTDERLDALAEGVMRHDSFEVKIDHLEGSVDDLRLEIRELRRDLTVQIEGLRSDLGGQINGLRSEVFGMKRWMTTVTSMWLLGIAGLFVELSLRT